MTNQELHTELSNIRSDIRGKLAAREDVTERRKLQAVVILMEKIEVALVRERLAGNRGAA